MRNFPGWLFFVGIFALVGATALCAVGSYVTARQIAIDLGDSGIETGMTFNVFAQTFPTVTPTPTLIPPTPTPLVEVPDDTPAIIEATATVTAVESSPVEETAVPQLSDPRIKTILLLGIDERSAVDTERAYRSDTIILANIDPLGQHVGLLSIPRDLYLSIPGYNASNFRVNQANYFGDLDNYPGGGGPALAAETIRANFGIRVDNYVRINFDVFFAVMDAVAPDGIEICVQEEIYDPKYPDSGYGTIEVRFEPGCQRLNAERLLQYARTRATEGGDFDRIRRQQQVIRAAQEQLLTPSSVAFIITQIPILWTQLAESVKTDLTLDEIIQLAGFGSTITSDDVTFSTIDTRHIIGFSQNEAGDQVTIPNWAAIRALVDETFNPRGELTLADLRGEAEREDASIVVYNNTQIPGLAANTRDWLASRQVWVENSVGNIPEPTNTDTMIRDYTGNIWTARYVAALLGIPEDRIVPGSDGLTSADIMVVAGADIQPLLAGE